MLGYVPASSSRVLGKSSSIEPRFQYLVQAVLGQKFHACKNDHAHTVLKLLPNDILIRERG